MLFRSITDPANREEAEHADRRGGRGDGESAACDPEAGGDTIFNVCFLYFFKNFKIVKLFYAANLQIVSYISKFNKKKATCAALNVYTTE